MQFRWIDWNIGKVQEHGVCPEEAEEVIEGARAPYPRYRSDDKFLIWGSTVAGRELQVVYLLDEDGTVFVIHARPLTIREKWRENRRKRRRGS